MELSYFLFLYLDISTLDSNFGLGCVMKKQSKAKRKKERNPKYWIDSYQIVTR